MCCYCGRGSPSCGNKRNSVKVINQKPLLRILANKVKQYLPGWFLAWKPVLVHVPLVQEMFGRRKKTVKPKPANRGRFTRYYNTINAQNSS